MGSRGGLHQWFAAISVNLLTITFGFAEGWSSPVIYLLTSDQSPLPSGKITMDEASWLAALLPLGCLFGNLYFGYTANKYGRRIPLLLMSIPTIISWLLVLFSTNMYYLYVSRIIAGIFGGGEYMICSLFISEIADDRLRGTLGSTVLIAENSGMMLAYTLGHFFEFYTLPLFVIGLTIVFAISLYFLPESPLFLVKQDKIMEAKNSIKFYQHLDDGVDIDFKIDTEIAILKNTLKAETIKGPVTLSDFKSKPVIKAMTIGCVLVTLNQFSGVAGMLGYTATIFEEAGSVLEPNISAIISGAILLFGSAAAMILIDHTGRRMLFAISNIGTVVGLTVLGIYMMLKSWNYNVEAFNWIPLLSYSFVLFVAALGILTLPLVMLSELMPAKVKDFAVSICMTQLSLFFFITVKYLPFLTDYSFHGSMFLFAGVTAACELYIHFFVPETKGKSYDEIFESLQ